MKKKNIQIILSLLMICFIGLGFYFVFSRNSNDNKDNVVSTNDNINKDNDKLHNENNNNKDENDEISKNNEEDKNNSLDKDGDKESSINEHKDNKNEVNNDKKPVINNDSKNDNKDDISDNSGQVDKEDDHKDESNDTMAEENDKVEEEPEQQEPEPDKKPDIHEGEEEDKKEYVTMSIECSTAVNYAKDNPDKHINVPASGIILSNTKIEIRDGDTVFDILGRTLKNKNIIFQYSGSGGSVYIESINNLSEFDCGILSGWKYRVNGVYPNYGCGSYKVKKGDVIEWKYTCNL